MTKPKNMTQLTTKLNNGTVVAAVNDKKFGIRARTFINDTQAEKAAARLQEQGVKCSVYMPPANMRVRFIRILD
jgi:hypothetical protein